MPILSTHTLCCIFADLAEDIDEGDDEPSDPPAIFLSYQLGYQEKVKLLKHRLEQAGYTCWMDINQMGGGDKLYAKLDTGIRAAKVIISCVSEKYARSPNCNREVREICSITKMQQVGVSEICSVTRLQVRSARICLVTKL